MSFDAVAFGPITLNHLPPFAQRLRQASDLVWEEGYRQPFLRELGHTARFRASASRSTCCRITAT